MYYKHMNIVLLLVTAGLTTGFLYLIGENQLIYIPIMICGAVMLYGVRLLYRNSTTRKNTILPYIQKQLLRNLISVTIIR
jgi:hypothetical protein